MRQERASSKPASSAAVRPQDGGRLIRRLMLLDAFLSDSQYPSTAAGRDKFRYFDKVVKRKIQADWYPHRRRRRARPPTRRDDGGDCRRAVRTERPNRPGPGDLVEPRASDRATTTGASGLPAPRVCSVRVLRARLDRQLVEGPQRQNTRSTTAAQAAAPPTCRRQGSKGCSLAHSPSCGQRLGTMRLLKESVLQIWKARKAAASEGIATAERAAKAVQ